MAGRIVLFAVLLLVSTGLRASDWRMSLTQWDDGRLVNERRESGAVERRELSLAYRWEAFSSGRRGAGFRYVHQPLLIRAGDPAHNGYLHQLDWRQAASLGHLEGSLTLGVHGTSNQFKHADFHRDSLVVTGSVWYGENNRASRIGLAGDYRFGRFLVYPRWQWRAELGGQALIAHLPIAVHIGPADDSNRWRLGIERYGDKWATLDSERELRDALYLSEWRLGGHYRVPLPGRDWQLELGAGVSLATRVRYRDRQLGQQRERLADRIYASLGLHW